MYNSYFNLLLFGHVLGYSPDQMLSAATVGRQRAKCKTGGEGWSRGPRVSMTTILIVAYRRRPSRDCATSVTAKAYQHANPIGQSEADPRF